MSKQRFLVAVVITVVFFAGGGILWIFLSTPLASETCAPARQLELVTGFKGNVIWLGLWGAVFAAILYTFMLQYQVFFPGRDAKRFAAAMVSGVVLAFLLVLIGWFSGPQCLKTALGSGSAIADELSSIDSLAGHFVSNVWLAMFLDQIVFAFVFTVVARFWRQVWLRVGT